MKTWKDYGFEFLALGLMIFVLGWATVLITASHGAPWALGSTAALIIFSINKAQTAIIEAIEKGKE